MEEYVSNSLKSKEQKDEPEKRVEKPVVTSTVSTKKKNGLRKFSEVFIAEDAANVGNYIWKDVLIPTIRDMVANAVKGSIDMMFYGSASKNGYSRNNAPRASYRAYYDDYNRRDYDNRVRTTSIYNFEPVPLDSRQDAEDLLTDMLDILQRYGICRVADMYDLVKTVDENGNPIFLGKITDNNYGWTDLRTACAEYDHRSGKWFLKLPKALPI